MRKDDFNRLMRPYYGYRYRSIKFWTKLMRYLRFSCTQLEKEEKRRRKSGH